jgi:very-short-patch-repair endonuclease
MNTKTQDWIAQAITVHGKRYDYSKVVYVNTKHNVSIGCTVHGYFEQRPSNHIMGSGCSKCSFESKYLSLSDWITKAGAKHPDRFDYSKILVLNSRTDLLTIRCRVHNTWFKITAGRHLDTVHGGCVDCSAKSPSRRQTTEHVIAAFKTVHGTRYDYRHVVYSGRANPVVIVCSQHGAFKQNSSDHKQGHGCPECGKDNIGNKHRTTLAEAIAWAQQGIGDQYDFSLNTEYTGNQYDYAQYVCPKHGLKQARWYSIWAGHGCDNCGAGSQQSKAETWLISFLEGKGLKVVPSAKGVLSGRHSLDLYLPDVKLAIEVNGVYWHSERAGKGKDYHITKTLECRDQGIQLLHLWDYELRTKRQQVLALIRSRLGLNNTVGARNLELRAIDNHQARQFLNQYHLQGHVNCTEAWALYSTKRKQLAAVMTFGPSRFDRKHSWELLRFASVSGLTVQGGASRLLKAFERNHPQQSLVSYADIRYSQGNVYRQLGFNFVHRSSPGYFYSKGSENGSDIVSRYKAQKHKLASWLPEFDANLTEAANMSNNGYYRVWDCGNLVYTKSY